MGYNHWVLAAVCKCGTRSGWKWEQTPRKLPTQVTCRCGTRNILGKLPDWPNVPRTLYIGHDRHNQMKVHAVPPEAFIEDAGWAQPYSIRSFVDQASKRLGGCAYSTRLTGQVLGESVFSDSCGHPETEEVSSCHLVAGFTMGQPTCALWKQIAALCQTDAERRFLYQYLGLVKDRQFPMLIPQARIGIAERRRPDFVAFVPLQYFRYKYYAVQLDAAHPEERDEADRLRDDEIALHGYEVLSLRPEGQGYLEEVKRLVEQIERDMKTVEDDFWKVALDVKVVRAENTKDDDVPF
jgi:hypothetical protein